MKKTLTLSCIALTLFFSMACSDKNTFPRSDHFDGEHFFNPTISNPNKRSIFFGLKIWMEIGRTVWPKNVENHPYLRLSENLTENDVAVTLVNHSTFLIQFKGINILTDPVWSKKVGVMNLIGPTRVRKPGINFENLPHIDLVVISHNHYDHMDLPTLKKLNEKFSPTFLVPLGNKEQLESIGIKKVTQLDWWKDSFIKDMKITFTPTQHFSSRGLFDYNKALWGSYMFQFHGSNIYFGGDSGYSIHYKEIYRRLGESDLAFLPIGAYEPNQLFKSMHMKPEEAVQAHLDLHSKQSVGIHEGTFKVAAEAINQPRIDLKKALVKLSIAEDKFVVLEEGQTHIFNLQHRK